MAAAPARRAARGTRSPVAKLARTGVVREPGHVYFLDGDGDVARSVLRPGRPLGRPQKLVRLGIPRDSGALYFIDRDGDVASVPRAFRQEPPA